MGLAVGLAWIIIGIVYIIYKFCTEKLGQTSGNAILTILKGVFILMLVGAVLGVIVKSDIAILILQSCIMLIWCVLVAGYFVGSREERKASLKEEQLPSEVTKENIGAQANRVRQYKDGTTN